MTESGYKEVSLDGVLFRLTVFHNQEDNTIAVATYAFNIRNPKEDTNVRLEYLNEDNKSS